MPGTSIEVAGGAISWIGPSDSGRVRQAAQGDRRTGTSRRPGPDQHPQSRLPEPLQGHRRRARRVADRRGRDPRDRRGDERRGDLHRLARLLRRGDAERPDDAARLHGRPPGHRAAARRAARLPRLGHPRLPRPRDARAAPRGLAPRSLVHPAGRGARPDHGTRERVLQRPRQAERTARARESAHDDDGGPGARDGVRAGARLPGHDAPGGVRRRAGRGQRALGQEHDREARGDRLPRPAAGRRPLRHPGRRRARGARAHRDEGLLQPGQQLLLRRPDRAGHPDARAGDRRQHRRRRRLGQLPEHARDAQVRRPAAEDGLRRRHGDQRARHAQDGDRCRRGRARRAGSARSARGRDGSPTSSSSISGRSRRLRCTTPSPCSSTRAVPRTSTRS